MPISISSIRQLSARGRKTPIVPFGVSVGDVSSNARAQECWGETTEAQAPASLPEVANGGVAPIARAPSPRPPPIQGLAAAAAAASRDTGAGVGLEDSPPRNVDSEDADSQMGTPRSRGRTASSIMSGAARAVRALTSPRRPSSARLSSVPRFSLKRPGSPRPSTAESPNNRLRSSGQADVSTNPWDLPEQLLTPSSESGAKRKSAGNCATGLATPGMTEQELMTRQILATVYERPLTDGEARAVLVACPEIHWLAQCAVQCPLPPGWRQASVQNSDLGGIQLYECETTGDITEAAPHLSHFARLSRLCLQARQSPSESASAVAWVQAAVQDASAEASRTKEGWTGPLYDPATGHEYFHRPSTGRSCWTNPASAPKYLARVAERLLDSPCFPKAMQALDPPAKKVEAEKQSKNARTTSEASEESGQLQQLATEIREIDKHRKQKIHEVPVKHGQRLSTSGPISFEDSSAATSSPLTPNFSSARKKPSDAAPVVAQLFDLFAEESSPRSSKRTVGAAAAEMRRTWDDEREDFHQEKESQGLVKSCDPEVFEIYTARGQIQPTAEGRTALSADVGAVPAGAAAALAGAAAALAVAAKALADKGSNQGDVASSESLPVANVPSAPLPTLTETACALPVATRTSGAIDREPKQDIGCLECSGRGWNTVGTCVACGGTGKKVDVAKNASAGMEFEQAREVNNNSPCVEKPIVPRLKLKGPPKTLPPTPKRTSSPQDAVNDPAPKSCVPKKDAAPKDAAIESVKQGSVKKDPAPKEPVLMKDPMQRTAGPQGPDDGPRTSPIKTICNSQLFTVSSPAAGGA